MIISYVKTFIVKISSTPLASQIASGSNGAQTSAAIGHYYCVNFAGAAVDRDAGVNGGKPASAEGAGICRGRWRR